MQETHKQLEQHLALAVGNIYDTRYPLEDVAQGIVFHHLGNNGLVCRLSPFCQPLNQLVHYGVGFAGDDFPAASTSPD